MACTPPTTRSPGHLRLHYSTEGGIRHQLSIRVLNGISIDNQALMQTNADNLAGKVGLCLPASCLIDTWDAVDNTGVVHTSGGITSPVTGSHTVATGLVHSYSRTVTLTGHGIPGTSGACTGAARLVMWTNNAYQFDAGDKTTFVFGDSGLTALAGNLTGSSVYWADFYGQKATVHNQAPVQYNAATQRRWGS